MRTLLAVAAVAAALLPGTASAGVMPKVATGSCTVEVTNGTAECIVQLDPNTGAYFGQSTWSGYGSADLVCYVSGRSFHLEGGYGSEWVQWSHGADLCKLTVRGWDGRSSAYVD